MNKTCLNCHFLIREGIDPEDNQKYKVTLWLPEREKLKDKIRLPNINTPSRYRCEKGVWDSSSYLNLDKLKDDIFNKKRNNCLYYYTYTEGMALEAVKDMQEQTKQRNNQRRNFILAIIAIIIALSSAITSIIALFK